MKILSQDIRSPGRKRNPGFPDYEAGESYIQYDGCGWCIRVSELESLYEVSPRADPEDKKFMFLFTNAYNEWVHTVYEYIYIYNI
jgi:hypothetical protein